LENRSAIITGAASGIGRAAALHFCREGARVLLADLDGDGAARAVSEIEEAGGCAEAIAADISGEEGARTVIARCRELWGGVDILVNNAAVFHYRRVEDATPADWDKVMAVNVVGTSLCSRFAIEAMKESGSGTIVNIGSINGLIGMPNQFTYNASKAAIIEMSKSMAIDLGPFNIRVNCVCPGVTDTPALQRTIDEMGLTVDAVIEGYIAPRCIIKRFGRAEEVAAVIAFLASEEASYMTGAVVVVDGGFTV
jgi:NAD(P)-dependent dehydrogenase (short-subunit alcohol dehydrogenase family)